MKLSDFDYNLPEELIAQRPIEPRDHSRLLILDKSSGEIKHASFFNLPNYLNKGDILVLNKSKVFPARLIGKKETGGQVEIFLSKQVSENRWEALGRKVKISDLITFNSSPLEAKILEKQEEIYKVEFNLSGDEFFSELEKIGLTPLPPYIKRLEEKTEDKKRYQTVYAKDTGSVAAPTAGLHFTDNLIDQIKAKGVEIKEVILHVGLGTFAPVKTENILEHEIHSEYYSIDKETFDYINKAKKENRRIIAVGTTTTRVLEHIFSQKTPNLTGWTNIFIYPGYEFQCIDSLITNFHLPKSTLLMLVSALAGKKNIDSAYKEAIKQKYRFFSYGDAMLIV